MTFCKFKRFWSWLSGKFHLYTTYIIYAEFLNEEMNGAELRFECFLIEDNGLSI